MKISVFYCLYKGNKIGSFKNKSHSDLPALKNQTEVMSLLERLNYTGMFIAHLTTTCDPIYRLLKKYVVVRWIEDCKQAFETIGVFIQFSRIGPA